MAYQLNMVSSVAGAGAIAFSLKDTDETTTALPVAPLPDQIKRFPKE
ncbi:MAG TPA: hypothetical protein VFD62_13850 [Pyrinomonadaceae bacterium]|nr:hypothetical protein [Pyrinomonadaceae bacterium]